MTALRLAPTDLGAEFDQLIIPMTCGHCGGRLVYENGALQRVSLAHCVVRCTQRRCWKRYVLRVEMTLANPGTDVQSARRLHQVAS